MADTGSTEHASLHFPPIAEYGFLSDCENNCLVAPDGAVEWLCLPRPDAPSVFAAILDRTAGLFRFGARRGGFIGSVAQPLIVRLQTCQVIGLTAKAAHLAAKPQQLRGLCGIELL